MAISEKTSNSTESYPQVLRHKKSEVREGEEEEGGRVNRDKDIQIPVLDLERLDAGELREACREWGMFRVEKHGIPLTVTSRLREISKELLSLPLETKRKLTEGTEMSYLRGTPALTPSGSAVSRPTADVINLVEGFNVPLSSLTDLAEASPSHPLLQPFREWMEEYGRHMSRVAVTLFEGIAETLNLDVSGKRRSEYLSEKTGLVRVYRYPRVSGGMEAHTDSSVLSILNQDQVGGLEFLRDGQWLPVHPLPDTLLVNLGDMMQAMSNDEYKSVKHRVGVKEGKDRESICYFVFPEKDKVISSSRYKPFTYSQFQSQVQLDLQTLGAKVGLPRFSLFN